MPRFHVQRSIPIEASPETIFETVANFGTWTTWSPWLCAEPEANVTISADPSSVGSLYAWNGELVGEGEIEHKQLESGRLIEEEIRFQKPYRSVSQVRFDIEPAEQGSRITWHMHGSLPWFLFWMKSQMESFIGMDYERGLRMLKELIETGQVLSRTTIAGIESVPGRQLAGIRKTCTFADVGPSMDAAFEEAQQQFSERNLPVDVGAASAYHHCDMKAQTFDYTSGFFLPDEQQKLDAAENLSVVDLPAGQTLKVEHEGSYQNLGNAWSAAHQYSRYKKLKTKTFGYEIYLNNPKQTEPADLITEIYLPLN